MKIPNQRVKDAVRRLGNDSDFTILTEYLMEVREDKRLELEDCNQAVQSHKLQGYCQALTDLLKTCRN